MIMHLCTSGWCVCEIGTWRFGGIIKGDDGMKQWKFYTSNELKPKGWLKRQLEIQANGLSGNLDKMWPDIRDSAWIGGDREGWERVPYWLDGFIPLAYLLENEDMISRARKYIDAIIARRRAFETAR